MIVNKDNHPVNRDPSAAEIAAITELFQGYEPSYVRVFPSYCSDGPGYRGWLAITVGGEPQFCSTFTKNKVGIIELCGQAIDRDLNWN